MSFFSVDLRNPRALARFLYTQRIEGFRPSQSVGLDDLSVARFLALLRSSRGYLEFGSGGSTLEAGRLGVRTLSVESDRFFAAAVRRALPPSACVEIVDINLGITREWSRPIFTSRSRARLRRWRRYVSVPFERLDQLGWFPDFVFIDGRFRRACALQAASEALYRGNAMTMMIDDYFSPGREHYYNIEKWLGTPERCGRAAIFEIKSGKTIKPSASDIAQAVEDYE